MKFIIVVGNPVDGFGFYGPYDSEEEAGEAAENSLRNQEWWIAPLGDVSA